MAHLLGLEVLGASRHMRRKLWWRIVKGRHWLDLVEEVDEDGIISYVGLVDGRAVVRGASLTSAGVALIRLAAKPLACSLLSLAAALLLQPTHYRRSIFEVHVYDLILIR